MSSILGRRLIMLLQHPAGRKQPVAIKVVLPTPRIESILQRSLQEDEFLTKREVEQCGAVPPVGSRIRLVPFTISQYLPLELEERGCRCGEQNRVNTAQLKPYVKENNLDKE